MLCILFDKSIADIFDTVAFCFGKLDSNILL